MSKLVLPERIGMRPNDGGDKNGAFPEFIHGFYHNNGLDAGLLYSTSIDPNGGYYLFVNGNPGVCDWAQNNTKIPLPTNRTVYLYSHLQGGEICNEVYSDRELNNRLSYLNATIYPDAYKLMINGCTINREMTLAVNKRISTNDYELPAECYFSATEFTESRSYTTRNSAVRMTADNSLLENPYIGGQYLPTYDDEGSRFEQVFRGNLSGLNRTVGGDYVSDECSGSINGRYM